METHVSQPLDRQFGKFKSYYVVWKPTYTFPAGSGLGEFKSYYVVWKLPNKDNYSLLENV